MSKEVGGMVQSRRVQGAGSARTDDQHFEVSIAHELGHVLGLWHVPPGSGYVMEPTAQLRRSDDERWLSQWAYEVDHVHDRLTTTVAR